MSLVFYCRPWTCTLVVHEVASQHEDVLKERRRSGGFCPRTLWAARPEVFRSATPEEEARLKLLGYRGWDPHEHCVVDDAITREVPR